MDYLTKEDWNCFLLPKICDDKSFSEHLKENIKIQNSFIRLINNIINSQKNSEKKLFQRILISSMIYYYKYILFNNISHSDLSSLDKLVLFCSSIFLSFKEANKLIHINILSSKFQPFFKKFKIFEIEEIRDLIIQKEFDILMSIEFNMAIDSPYELLNYIKLYLTKLQKGNETIVRIINYINLNLNDSILFPLCLYYTPIEILFSCILLAKKEFKLDFININDLIKINKYQIEIDNINKCALYISKIKKYKNELIEQNLNSKKDNIRNNDNFNIKNISLIKNNII
jgi:hypothetical protein